jgi:hypothetical protein
MLELAGRYRQAQREEDRPEDDPTVKRFSELELNPRKGRGSFTVKGERMYKHVLESQRLSAARKQADAKRIAAATVRGAAARGVPGLVRKNPGPPRMFRAQKVVSTLERGPAPVFHKRGAIVTSSEDLVHDTLSEYLSDRAHEAFLVLFINTRNQVIGFTEFTCGSPSMVEVHPQGIMQAALGCNAAAFITVHNHPTGDPDPSEADRRLWERLSQAGDLIGVPALDHLVVGDGLRYFSLAESRASGVE